MKQDLSFPVVRKLVLAVVLLDLHTASLVQNLNTFVLQF